MSLQEQERQPANQKVLRGLARAIARATWLVKHKVFGRDKERDRICRMLHEVPGPCGPSSTSSRHYSVIGIHGIAGSGKSTLAQYVCDYEKDEGNHFDLVMFIHVSTTFRVGDIFREMLEQVTQKQPSNDEGLKSLQKELKEKLKSKRFLLVLDDVWVNGGNSKDRAILLDVLDSGKSGSGILVTAQREDAARALGAQELIAISDLEEEQYFSMFMHHALQSTGPIDNQEHIIIGRKIAEKLHRSPIAAVTVAARLCVNPDIDFWRTTANLDVLNETMGALWWSYQQLDADIRRCFEYCSIFPRGYKLKRDELVRMWIAQGFVKTSNTTEDLEDVGHRYFDELLAFSFLQVEGTFFTSVRFTIHGLLHLFAERVAGGDFFRIDVNVSQKDIPPEVCHLFIKIPYGVEIKEKILDMENLRTLIIIENPGKNFHEGRQDLISEKLFENIFTGLRKLRVLIVKTNSCKTLAFSVPASIGEMKHLRYLSFQSTERLKLIFPTTFSKLYHMQILDICDFKLSCAEDIANLIHLRHISALWQCFPNICRLTSLKTMPSFIVRNTQGYELKQLKHLNNLRILAIHGLEFVRSKEEALEAQLACKKQLTRLFLVFDRPFFVDEYIHKSDVEAEVLEGLCPPKDLVELHIRFYIGSRYPSWMLNRQNPDAPNHLDKLVLYGCTQLVSIPEGCEFFIRLRRLRISWCTWDALPDNMECLMSLQELHINYCKDIKILPTLPYSLKHIIISGNATPCSRLPVNEGDMKIGKRSSTFLSKNFVDW
ncbi:hypothetical protein ACP4OV_002343 [Aristida adscensionis]